MGQKSKTRAADKRVVNRIRRAYLCALTIIAAVSIGVFMLERGAVERFESVANIVNTSGKQRMLSQRISIFAGKFAYANDAGTEMKMRETVSSMRDEFVLNHDRIMNMGVGFGSDDDELSEGSLKIYYGGRYLLADRVRTFIENVDQLLLADPADRGALFNALEEEATTNLLVALDAAVTQFERDAKVKVMETVQLQLWMLAAIMMVLVSELVFIFRPLAKSVELRTQELREARDEMSHAATHDQLTGLANRRLLNEIQITTLAQSKRSKQPMTVCHLDLDYFKIINDTRGHAVGDAVLIHVAKTLKAATRASDFIARVGGDEFVIIDSMLGNTAGAEVMAKRIVERISRPFEIEGEMCKIGVSIGIAEHDPEDEDIEAALHRADIALYHAKELGRNQVVVYSDTAQETFEARTQKAA